jgi:hypothetical protein
MKKLEKKIKDAKDAEKAEEEEANKKLIKDKTPEEKAAEAGLESPAELAKRNKKAAKKTAKAID